MQFVHEIVERKNTNQHTEKVVCRVFSEIY